MVESLIHHVVTVVSITLGHSWVCPLWKLTDNGINEDDTNGDCTRKFRDQLSTLFHDGFVGWHEIRHPIEIRTHYLGQLRNLTVEFHSSLHFYCSRTFTLSPDLSRTPIKIKN
jgi:hypothetical protein